MKLSCIGGVKMTNNQKTTHKRKRQISISLNVSVIDYFKNMSEKTGVPYQTLINMYLVDCVQNEKQMTWE